MDPILLVSPHLDDAALGAGEFIASYPGAHVATVCTGTPADHPLTSFDRESGFASTEQAVKRRRAEDIAAMRDLGAVHRHLGLLDSQYLGGHPDKQDAIVEVVAHAVVVTGAMRLFTVLGLLHPDHVAVHAAVAVVAAELRLPWWCWEELPHRVLEPEVAVDRARLLGGTPDWVGGDQLAKKQRAVSRYASQRWALNLRACWTPERFWRMP